LTLQAFNLISSFFDAIFTKRGNNYLFRYQQATFEGKINKMEKQILFVN